ncbi:hypothetical protein OG558_00085 [Kribbella sp. NBC_01510]|uniref:hypothetical protein n=1 Tax=Kribbella sp. NBC_01510 TaxID=2903581 RepID=UPI00386A70EA
MQHAEQVQTGRDPAERLVECLRDQLDRGGWCEPDRAAGIGGRDPGVQQIRPQARIQRVVRFHHQVLHGTSICD